MVRSKRIQPVTKLAGQAERKAAMELANTRFHLNDLRNKLDIMKTYRKEYERKAGETGMNVKVRDLQHNQVFLQQLDEAIAILEKQVQRQREITLQDQKKWVATWKHMNSLNKAMHNFRTRENLEKERREQHTLDEHVLKSR